MSFLNPSELILFLTCILFIAMLYASVGHGGASGYIAVMALFSVAPGVIKPTALVLNILVSCVATIHFARAGYFSWRLFWPFAVTSIPCSFIGGSISLPSSLLKPLLGTMLLWSAYRLYVRPQFEEKAVQSPSLPVPLLVGAIFGMLSGLTGVGGGIFLSPLLLLMGWAGVKETAAISAPFILVNSLAGLMGYSSNMHGIPHVALLLATVALCGGITGSLFGSRWISNAAVVRTLFFVLIIAGIKLLVVGGMLHQPPRKTPEIQVSEIAHIVGEYWKSGDRLPAGNREKRIR